ncbi:MAG: FAD-dependent monooxygenase, partial [Mycobacterium sp.]
MPDTEVIVVGAGPAGLMLAVELCLAGVRPLVVERQPTIRETPKALGVGGQILHLLRYRGLLGRLEAANTDPIPPPRFPFGGVHLDFSHLTDPPMPALPLAQPQLEAVLDECARELGADIRRGHDVTAVSQDEMSVIAEVGGPQGRYGVSARYLVGCDGPRSRIRAMAGVPFPGVVYPEVNRLGQLATHHSVARLDDGGLEVPGVGTVHAGFTRTDRGVFGLGTLSSGELMVYTSEDDPGDYRHDPPMTLAELQDSIRRILGVSLPLGEPSRLSRFTFEARQADRYRAGRILLAGDAAHLFPATGIALNAGMLDAVNLGWKLAAEIHGWAQAGLLDTYHDERHLAGGRTLLHTRAQVA